MKNLSIRLQVLMVALVPLIAIVTIVMLYSVVTGWRNLDLALSDHGRAIVRQMAPACEYGVFSGNTEILTRLVNAAGEPNRGIHYFAVMGLALGRLMELLARLGVAYRFGPLFDADEA